jgi:hypothetical protein
VLRIRSEQVMAMEEVRMPAFEGELVKHLVDFTPLHAELLGESGLRGIVRAGVERSRQYGFTRRGPVRFFIELLFMLGWSFDSDPQLTWVKEVLDEPSVAQMLRADRLHQLVMHYRDIVGGKRGEIAVRSLRRARQELFAIQPLSGEGLEDAALRRMETVHPEKYEYVGVGALRDLIRMARTQATSYSLTSGEAHGLIIGLMFALGSGVITDPKYPWIKRTLTNAAISDPDRRAERVYSKAMTYLDHVIAHLARN